LRTAAALRFLKCPKRGKGTPIRSPPGLSLPDSCKDVGLLFGARVIRPAWRLNIQAVDTIFFDGASSVPCGAHFRCPTWRFPRGANHPSGLKLTPSLVAVLQITRHGREVLSRVRLNFGGIPTVVAISRHAPPSDRLRTMQDMLRVESAAEITASRDTSRRGKERYLSIDACPPDSSLSLDIRREL
jgi:hypothetical protein